jgi:hypothetical protein
MVYFSVEYGQFLKALANFGPISGKRILPLAAARRNADRID